MGDNSPSIGAAEWRAALYFSVLRGWWHNTGGQGVAGSNPAVPTTIKNRKGRLAAFFVSAGSRS